MLPALAADTATAAAVEQHARRERVIAALVQLGAVTTPEQIRELLLTCPELATNGVAAEAELSERLNWPPEAAGLLAARGALISVLAWPVTGAGLEAAFDAFAAAREAAMTEIVQAGYQKIIWLGQHASAPDSEWDAAAAQALRLLGFGGDGRGRAMLLRRVGVAIARRPAASRTQVDWAVRYLRDSRELLLELGDGDEAASVGSDLAMALHVSDYGDVYAKMAEAEAVLRDVVAYRSQSAGQAGVLGMSMTNLAVVLLRAAQLDKRQDRVEERPACAARRCRCGRRPRILTAGPSPRATWRSP